MAGRHGRTTSRRSGLLPRRSAFLRLASDAGIGSHAQRARCARRRGMLTLTPGLSLHGRGRKATGERRSASGWGSNGRFVSQRCSPTSPRLWESPWRRVACRDLALPFRVCRTTRFCDSVSNNIGPPPSAPDCRLAITHIFSDHRSTAETRFLRPCGKSRTPFWSRKWRFPGNVGNGKTAVRGSD